MRNVTGRESFEFSSGELLALADEAKERNAPPWVARELGTQALSQFIPLVRE